MQDVVQNVTNVIRYFMSGLVQRGRMGFPKSSLILILKEINCFEVEKQKQAFDLSPISSETKFTPIFLKMSFSLYKTWSLLITEEEHQFNLIELFKLRFKKQKKSQKSDSFFVIKPPKKILAPAITRIFSPLNNILKNSIQFN